MEKIQHITSIDKFENLSIREICRRTGKHYETVKKYLNKEDWNTELKPKRVYPSKLDPVKPIIVEWLTDDLKSPRKQRHTGTRVYNRLKAEHSELLAVGMQCVINYVAKVKKELSKTAYDCAIYGDHPFGEAQLDFGVVFVKNGQNVTKTYFELVMSFPASNGSYTQICKSQNQECLLQAMQNIFNYMGGVPKRILFDNMSTAVAKILKNGQRTLANGFARFTLHHRFEAVFCNPNSGNEKGSVENKVGYTRRNLFVPIPKVTDLAKYNEQLLILCDEDMKREHYKIKEQICDLLENDKECFLTLPNTPFKVSKLEKVKTDKYSFFPFDNNTYSSNPSYPKEDLWIEITADEVRVLNEKYELITVHNRSYEVLTKPIVNWIEYLPAIVRKPFSFMHVEYFKTLPDIWQSYFKNNDRVENRKMLDVLVPLILESKLDLATTALEIMNKNAPTDADSFLACYRSLTEEPIYLPEVITENTPPQIPYVSDLSVYTSLMGLEEEVM